MSKFSEEEATRRILEEQIRPGRWALAPPTEGRQTGAYIAKLDAREVFVKWDVDGVILERLGELGVSPRLVAMGSSDGRSYVIQSLLDGSHPTRSWFGENIPNLAGLIRTYHCDPQLKRLIMGSTEYQPPSATEAANLDVEIRGRGLPAFSRREFLDSFGEWRLRAEAFSVAETEPVHADPNLKNFLLSQGRVYLVDWDGASVCDPIRDIGPLLWWYVSPSSWNQFFEALERPMTDEIVDRVYWWAAYRSLSVALELAQQGAAVTEIDAFVRDFEAAAVGGENPR